MSEEQRGPVKSRLKTKDCQTGSTAGPSNPPVFLFQQDGCKTPAVQLRRLNSEEQATSYLHFVRANKKCRVCETFEITQEQMASITAYKR